MLKVIANWWGDSAGEIELPATRALSGTAQSLPATISVKDEREDEPKFKRTYTATIMRGIRVAVTFRNSYGSVYSGGELTQPGGRWVLFDPDRIADKIIDPVLLPEVERVVAAMKIADREFRRSRPASFVDERGKKWVRADSIARSIDHALPR